MILLSVMVTDVTKRHGSNIPNNFDKPSDHHFVSRNLKILKVEIIFLMKDFTG